jgi:hypothetical protein
MAENGTVEVNKNRASDVIGRADYGRPDVTKCHQEK